MSAKPETNFYRRVNAKLTLDVHRQKVTSLYGNGTPDFWYSGRRCDGWVEYKWEPKLSRNGVDPVKLLSSLQLLWINRRYDEGRVVLVVIGSPAGCAILECGEWNSRVAAESFRYSLSDVSAYLEDKFHAATEVSRARSSGD